MDSDVLTDSAGTEMDRDDVEDVATRTVMASMSMAELAGAYVEQLTDDELIEWATDEDGRFTDG